MIIVDTALKKLEAAGTPIRVGIIGAGYMGRGIAHQLSTPIPGMRLVAISNRTLDKAVATVESLSRCDAQVIRSDREIDGVIESGRIAVTDDALDLCQSGCIDVLLECTGAIEFGAEIALSAIENGKHLILVNAELDATLGPLLKHRAAQAGVVLTNTDGDEPGVAMNLLRFVETIGYQPVMAGNIKGFYNPYRNPDTQQEFAKQARQSARMITSFADGTKLSMETAILANATGFGVNQRGMTGYEVEHVKDLLQHLQAEPLLQQGRVDFVLGAQPGTGAFVVGYNDHPVKQEYMSYFKMGDGPLYLFYTPFHLTHLQAAVTVGRVACFHDAAVTPIGPPVCDVVSVAKRDLRAGETLDGLGGFTCYGMIENAPISRQEDLLPMGLGLECRLLRDVPQDQAITYHDVELPTGRLIDRLKIEQNTLFEDALKQVEC